MLSMKDLPIKMLLTCGWTKQLILSASLLVLLLWSIRHSVSFNFNVERHVRYTSKSVKIVPAKKYAHITVVLR